MTRTSFDFAVAMLAQVWLGEDRKCSAAVVGFRFVVRVIYGTAVFIKSIF